MRRVVLLGASGSIGTQTLDIIEKHPDRFVLKAISVGHQVDKVPLILKRFPSIEKVCVIELKDKERLQKAFPLHEFYFGDEGLLRLIDSTSSDMVVNALVGFAGVAPTLRSLEKDKILCLANKESLVVAGELVNGLRQAGHGRLIPIDSEHVAIAKLLDYVGLDQAAEILITASGGPFRDRKREELADITPLQALAHPTWRMGKKISIDSATMMNKGFEVIEAAYLFNWPLERIKILIHPESHVHSLVLGKDGKYYADVSAPDMHGPIEYALMEKDYPFTPVIEDRLSDYAPFHFRLFDPQRFPAVDLALKAYSSGGNAGAILNGANEAAVYSFLNGELPFLQIEEAVGYALASLPLIKGIDYRTLKETDAAARQAVARFVEGSKD